MLQIHTTSTPLEDASAKLNKVLTDAKGKDVLLLLSSGSALQLFDHIDISLLGSQVTISVLHERWTYNEEHSNFTQLTKRPLWQKTCARGVPHIDPRPHEPEDLQDTAKRFDLALKHWHITHRDGVVVATMSVGKDGHTAGILPFTDDEDTFKTLFTHTSTCIRGYTASQDTSVRTKCMTVTLTYLKRHVAHAIVYMAGTNKQAALQAILMKNAKVHELPAQLLHDVVNGHLYTDLVSHTQ